MGMLLTGALGFTKGYAEKSGQISDEKRKALAEQLRMDALEQMNKRMAKFEHGLDLETRAVDSATKARAATKKRAFDTTQGFLRRKSAKELNDATLQVRKDIAAANDKYRTADLDRKDRANVLKSREILTKAQIEINDVFEKQGLTPESIEVINGLLETAQAPFRYTLTGEPGKALRLRKDIVSTQELKRVPLTGEAGKTEDKGIVAPGKKYNQGGGAGLDEMEAKGKELKGELGKVIGQADAMGKSGDKTTAPNVGSGRGESMTQGGPDIDVTPEQVPESVEMPEQDDGTEKPKKQGILALDPSQMRGPTTTGKIKKTEAKKGPRWEKGSNYKINDIKTWADRVELKDGEPYIVADNGELIKLTHTQRALWDKHIKEAAGMLRNI